MIWDSWSAKEFPLLSNNPELLYSMQSNSASLMDTRNYSVYHFPETAAHIVWIQLTI